MPSRYRDSRLKLKRARRHIAELEGEIAELIERQPYAIVPDCDDPCSYGLKIRALGDVTEPLSPIVGDVIHNLRAALDLLACGLVGRKGENTRKVYFPFSTSASTFDEALQKSRIGRAGSDVVDAIRSLKPYRDGDTALWGLHGLDIEDKHRALILLAVAGPGELLVFDEEFGYTTLATGLIPLEDGAIVGYDNTHDPKDPRFSEYFEVSFRIVFGGTGPFSNSDVRETLLGLCQLVGTTIKRFDLRFR
jgi:hypothetical protein